jgi:bifunctional UDP-N-acetylglucosamine pyrophosphorylase/glucosamine-1-phosphate N-acetyltransferase
LRKDQALRLTCQGVAIHDPDSCYIDPTVRLERGAKLLPGTILRGNSLIRSGAVVGPWSLIDNSEIGEGAVINASQVYRSHIGQEAFVGPFSHVRQNTELGRGGHIGSFVETKNAKIGENTWASHLSYLGDAEIGSNCNIGCGTATANYDRVDKHKTTIGDHAFIGCHTVLVAPVTVGEGAYIGAGSTITDNVPENALGIARNRQSNKKDWSSKHKHSQ